MIGSSRIFLPTLCSRSSRRFSQPRRAWFVGRRASLRAALPRRSSRPRIRFAASCDASWRLLVAYRLIVDVGRRSSSTSSWMLVQFVRAAALCRRRCSYCCGRRRGRPRWNFFLRGQRVLANLALHDERRCIAARAIGARSGRIALRLGASSQRVRTSSSAGVDSPSASAVAPSASAASSFCELRRSARSSGTTCCAARAACLRAASGRRCVVLAVLLRRCGTAVVHVSMSLELALVVLPLAVVVGGQHPDRGDQHRSADEAEDQVQQLRVAPSLFGGRHDRCIRPRCAASRVTELKSSRKYSGMADDVLQVERPAQHHLHRQRRHEQQQVGHQHVADEAHLDEELAEDRRRHQRRQQQ